LKSNKKFEEWFITHEEECVAAYKNKGGYEGTRKFFGEFCEEIYESFLSWKLKYPERSWRNYYAENRTD
jgi:hypothetical protein